MKIYLFLYPIRPYCEEGLSGIALRRIRERGDAVERLGEIIAARYRAKRYQVWWLCFSSPSLAILPDYSQLAPYLGWEEEDTFVACGVTFRDHVTFKEYPRCADILDQFPRRVTRLVLGGFHQGDCVTKLARAATKRGIRTMIDEDTTELFFCRTALHGPIPLVRPLQANVREVLARAPDALMRKLIREDRRNKPWLAKP